MTNLSRKFIYTLSVLLLSTGLQACTVVAIADAAASTVVGVGKVAVKGTIAVADAVIPDGDEDDDDDDEDNEERD